MEVKTATLLSSKFNREWNGPKGLIYYFDLKWSNGDEGQMSTIRIKNKTGEQIQEKFAVGVEQEYTTEQKENKQGKYWFFDKPKKTWQPGQGSGYSGPRKNDPAVQGRIIRSVALESAIKLKKATHHEGSLFEMANFLVSWIDSRADGDDGKGIAAQAALLRAVIMIEFSPEEKVKDYADLNKVINVAQMFFNYIHGQNE